MDIDKGAVVACIQPAARLSEHLPIEGRLMLWAALLTQEICLMPPAERGEALRDWIADLPDILRATENGMREAIAANARAAP